jgi:Holliday junction resolvase RusA-like endonuclease
MRVHLKFEVRRKPVPQARPRFFSRCRKCKYRSLRNVGDICRKCSHSVGAYDPANCKTFKEAVAWHAKIEALKQGLRNPVDSPVSIHLIFQMGINGKETYHTKRPDIDNLAKAVKDALKGVVYRDDSQIVEAHLFKQYGEPAVKIELKTLEGA